MRTAHAIGLLVLGGCASSSSANKSGMTTTTAAELSSMVEVDRASIAIRRGDYERALAVADDAVRTYPNSPWARYDRAVAFRHLGRTDASVAAFREAEERFSRMQDKNGRAISIYGRALALADVGRCAEARAAYREFADLVADTDPQGATMARAYANDCREGKPVPTDATVSAMSRSIASGDAKKVLELADSAPPEATNDPWFAYDRAAALAQLGRTDDAVKAYQDAERRFPEGSPGRRDAVYGRARALDAAGRCSDAARSYADYAGIIRASDPKGADEAMDMARRCKWK